MPGPRRANTKRGNEISALNATTGLTGLTGLSALTAATPATPATAATGSWRRRPAAAPAHRSSGAPNTSHWPATLFAEQADAEVRSPAVLHTAGGHPLLVDTVRWHAPPAEEERAVLQRAVGNILDVGCGPGRHVLALQGAGRTALGIDVSPAAVATARRRGARVTQVSVFGLVPHLGTWDTALLLDGNIGIGGHPHLLLRRLASVLRPGGHVLVELDGSQRRGSRNRVRVEHAGRRTPWFAWATVVVSDVGELAQACGYHIAELWQADGRWFADLSAPTAGTKRTA